jgi:hypothetical protein
VPELSALRARVERAGARRYKTRREILSPPTLRVGFLALRRATMIANSRCLVEDAGGLEFACDMDTFNEPAS